jgi:ATP-dependent Clp protease adaptor protein ClpS
MSEGQKDDDGLVIDRPPVEDKKKLQEPPKYAVMFLNDDYTPMEFVVAVLVQLFGKTSEEANSIMLEVHENNKALVASYTYDIATTKVQEVNIVAQREQFPFRAEVEALH